MTLSFSLDLKYIRRFAVIYVRQSDPLLVTKHPGSAERQRALAERAMEMGWSAEKIITCEDLGVSGQAGVERLGFQELMEYIRVRKIGIVFVTDETRLGRNDEDWGRLVETMAITDTLMCVNGEIMDLNQPDDRAAVGLGQVLSVHELQSLRRKMWASKLALAHQGRLRQRLPIGYVYRNGQACIDQRPEVAEAIRGVFRTFNELGSMRAVKKFYQARSLLLPKKDSFVGDGNITWHPVTSDIIRGILCGVTYSGTYAYGKNQIRIFRDEQFAKEKKSIRLKNPEDWHVYTHDAFEGYITWEKYQSNQEKIAENNYGERAGKIRSGRGLIQGIVICGNCGTRMHTRHSARNRCYYACKQGIRKKNSPCHSSLESRKIDQIVAEACLAALTPDQTNLVLATTGHANGPSAPMTALSAQVQQALEDVEGSRRKVLKALEHNLSSELMQELHQDWMRKQEHHVSLERSLLLSGVHRELTLNPHQRDVITASVRDLSRVWNHPNTLDEDRKRLLRLLVQSIEVKRQTINIYVVIHWHSGCQSSFVIDGYPRAALV